MQKQRRFQLRVNAHHVKWTEQIIITEYFQSRMYFNIVQYVTSLKYQTTHKLYT